jgi:hypothetical protein
MRYLCAALLALAFPAVAHAQTPTAVPSAFLGTWASLGLNPGPSPLGAPPTELPWAVLDKAIGEYMQPWAIAKQQNTEWNIDDTGQVCKPTGPFRQGHAGGGGFRFVDAGEGMLYQVGGSIDQRGVQRIRLNGPRSRTPRPTWNGESVGRIIGTDTLIIDTYGYNDKSWLNSDRWPHTEELRVIERYRLYGDGAYMQLRVFIDDRHALKQPYTYTRYYRRVAEPTEGAENVCNQNPPEDDLWTDRRNRLLDEFDARLDALIKKYENEPLPAGTDDHAAVAAKWSVAAAPPADVKLRTLAGVYEPVAAATSLPAGRKASGSPSEIALLAPAVATAKTRDLNFDPAKHCMVIGPFRMMARSDARFELLPTANRITMLFERTALGNKREVYLGRSAHPANFTPSYHGDSIARWEGDTLVVDTVGFNEFTWLNDAGAPHSDALHLVERLRLLPGGQILEYQVTAEDPGTLVKPYTYTRYFQRSATPLQEDFCENR